MSSEILYSEILKKFDDAPNRAGKLAVLQKEGDPRFRDFLFYAFHPDIKFDIQPPEYRPAIEPAGLNFTYLDSEINKLYRFITGHAKKSPDLKPNKQTQLLLVILESLHKDEAELLCKMFKKDLGIKYLTPRLIKEAYPEINLPLE